MEGPVAQLGWSVRLITERSRVQISPGPLVIDISSLAEDMIAIYLENIDFSEPFDARAPDQ